MDSKNMSDPTATTVAQQLGNLPVMTAEVQEAIERFVPDGEG